MKPGQFYYHAPESPAQVMDLLAEHGPTGGRILAGGQGIVPLMNAGQVDIDHVIDINRVREADYIRRDAGMLALGPLARLGSASADKAMETHAPSMAHAIRSVANPTIRNRATVCGSIAHAHPASQVAAVLVAFDGEVIATNTRGARTIPADRIASGPFANSLAPDEWLSEVRLSIPGPGVGSAFQAVARQNSPVLSVAVNAAVEDGCVRSCSIGIAGVAQAPYRPLDAERLLIGEKPTSDLIASAAAAAAESEHVVRPFLSTVHGSGSYRQHVAKVLVRRALTEAIERSVRGVRS